MPSMGMLGAISGGAQGLNMAFKEQMEEARAVRLEELRTKNSRETNKIDADQRHGQRMSEMEVGNQQDLSKLEKGHEYSLAQLKQSDEDARARMSQEDAAARARSMDDRAADRADEAGYEDWVDKDGNIIGKVNSRTKEREPFTQSSSETYDYEPVKTTDEYGNETTSGFRKLGNRGTDGGLVPAGEERQTSTAPGFKTMDEALAAAKTRYPNRTEAELRSAIARQYPDLK